MTKFRTIDKVGAVCVMLAGFFGVSHGAEMLALLSQVGAHLTSLLTTLPSQGTYFSIRFALCSVVMVLLLDAAEYFSLLMRYSTYSRVLPDNPQAMFRTKKYFYKTGLRLLPCAVLVTLAGKYAQWGHRSSMGMLGLEASPAARFLNWWWAGLAVVTMTCTAMTCYRFLVMRRAHSKMAR